MYCHNCGKAVSDVSRFCPYCGAQLPRAAAGPVDQRPVNQQRPAQGNPYQNSSTVQGNPYQNNPTVQENPYQNIPPVQGNPYQNIPAVQNPKGKGRAKGQTVDVRSIRPGLSKREFMNLPELKKEKSWLTWAGIVQIVTGVLNFASVGQLAELEAQGTSVSQGYMILLVLISVFFIGTGIGILRTTNMMLIYIVAGFSVVWIILVLATGGNIGVGALAILFAIYGARKIDGLWNEYQQIR